jgi:nitrogen regulatory protein PII
LILVYRSYCSTHSARHFDVRYGHSIAPDSKSQGGYPAFGRFSACLFFRRRAEIVQFLGNLLRLQRHAVPRQLEIRQRSRPFKGRRALSLQPNDKEGTTVKLIIATIKPFKLEEVREALTSIGVRGMMVTEIKGFGSQSGHTEIYRGAEYAVNFVPKVKLEIVVNAAMADEVVATIASIAKTDKIGDGKIFVLDVESALRVRTGEVNDDAI